MNTRNQGSVKKTTRLDFFVSRKQSKNRISGNWYNKMLNPNLLTVARRFCSDLSSFVLFKMSIFMFWQGI